jgi:hypothetical protein
LANRLPVVAVAADSYMAIVSTFIAANLYLDQRAKRAVEGAFSQATEVTVERVARASKAVEQSPFGDCPDCGSDLRSEADRSKEE